MITVIIPIIHALFGTSLVSVGNWCLSINEDDDNPWLVWKEARRCTQNEITIRMNLRISMEFQLEGILHFSTLQSEWGIVLQWVRLHFSTPIYPMWKCWSLFWGRLLRGSHCRLSKGEACQWREGLRGRKGVWIDHNSFFFRFSDDYVIFQLIRHFF